MIVSSDCIGHDADPAVDHVSALNFRLPNGGSTVTRCHLPAQVEDPAARVDILEQGGRYIESTEDFLRRTGHWLETEPPEEEIDAQLASDFADFAEPELRAHELLSRVSSCRHDAVLITASGKVTGSFSMAWPG